MQQDDQVNRWAKTVSVSVLAFCAYYGVCLAVMAATPTSAGVGLAGALIVLAASQAVRVRRPSAVVKGERLLATGAMVLMAEIAYALTSVVLPGRPHLVPMEWLFVGALTALASYRAIAAGPVRGVQAAR